MKISLPSLSFTIKIVFVLLGLYLIGQLAIDGKRILSPIIFACIFSILLLPLAKFLEKKCRFKRNMGALTSVLIMIAFIAGIFYFLGAQISRLSNDWPTFKDQLINSAGDVQVWVSQKFHIDADKQASYVHNATTKILASGTVASATLYSLSSVLLFLSFTFIYTFFFLLYRGLILKFLEKVFLERNGELVHEIVEQVQFIIRKYITGILIEMSVVASVVSIVFSLLGIKYAVLLGLITGLFNIIPYIGMLSAMIISSMITFATAASITKVIWVVAVLFGTHVIDYNLLLPLIVGSKVKINAMITLLGIIVGEMIWGIAGMFLSIPVIAVLKIIFDRIEPLKPWGFLMGDNDTSSKPAMEKIKDNQSSLEGDVKPDK